MEADRSDQRPGSAGVAALRRALRRRPARRVITDGFGSHSGTKAASRAVAFPAMTALLATVVVLLALLVALGVLTLLQLRDMQTSTQTHIQQALADLDATEMELAFLRDLVRPQ